MLICLISEYLSLKNRLKIKQVCQMARTEFVPNNFCDKRLFRQVTCAFNAFKTLKVEHRQRHNSWKRKLHTEDEIILLS